MGERLIHNHRLQSMVRLPEVHVPMTLVSYVHLETVKENVGMKREHQRRFIQALKCIKSSNRIEPVRRATAFIFSIEESGVQQWDKDEPSVV